jgi:hypothetical protein
MPKFALELQLFHAIIGDPPYGVRAGGRKVVQRDIWIKDITTHIIGTGANATFDQFVYCLGTLLGPWFLPGRQDCQWALAKSMAASHLSRVPCHAALYCTAPPTLWSLRSAIPPG